MKTPNSYEEVNKELDEVNELIELDTDNDIKELETDDRTFKFEYAFEGLTESHSAYKRRNSNV